MQQFGADSCIQPLLDFTIIDFSVKGVGRSMAHVRGILNKAWCILFLPTHFHAGLTFTNGINYDVNVSG